MGDTGGVGARVGIVAGMLSGSDHRAPSPDGAVRTPEPAVRPSEHAQWDEVNACWVKWDTDAEAWVRVDGDSPSPSERDTP